MAKTELKMHTTVILKLILHFITGTLFHFLKFMHTGTTGTGTFFCYLNPICKHTKYRMKVIYFITGINFKQKIFLYNGVFFYKLLKLFCTYCCFLFSFNGEEKRYGDDDYSRDTRTYIVSLGNNLELGK